MQQRKTGISFVPERGSQIPCAQAQCSPSLPTASACNVSLTTRVMMPSASSTCNSSAIIARLIAVTVPNTAAYQNKFRPKTCQCIHTQ
jgi:hypothetical protein